MSNVIPLRQPMRPADFVKLVQDRARFSHMVGLTDHARVRMAERDITLRQVLNVLTKGQLKDGPDWDTAHESWKGSMVYHGGGTDLHVVVALRESEQTVDVITVRKGR